MGPGLLIMPVLLKLLVFEITDFANLAQGNYLRLNFCVYFRTKRERADQFSRRMHKEAPLTKNQKEDIRHRNMHDRDIFDCNNLGGFRRSFPTPNCVSIVFLIRSGLNDWQTELKAFIQC